ncbi:hypothetical protein QUB56_30850 [Microcoleus sp. AR_TQ3_B6]
MIVNKPELELTFEQELVTDMIELITIFSAPLYGARNRNNKKLVEGISKAVTDFQK